MYLYCFPLSELQKYQQMLEPPPTAKPFIADVDKKLEEGQKVFNLSLLSKPFIGNLWEKRFLCLFWFFVLRVLRNGYFIQKTSFVLFYIYLFVCGNVEATWAPCGFLGFSSHCQAWGSSALTS